MSTRGSQGGSESPVGSGQKEPPDGLRQEATAAGSGQEATAAGSGQETTAAGSGQEATAAGSGQGATAIGARREATAVGRVVVIGVAIVVDGRVLVGQRSRPAALAGRWELPGGKVEVGESPERAAVREIAEELGCVVEVTGWLAEESAISRTHVLRVALARLVDGLPRATEHAELRWLGPDELDTVDWLAPDLPLLPELAAHLRAA